MGESEVRAARNAARPRSGQRYVIIYVANPATSDETRIDVLPNPMSEEADGVLHLLGEGVRYGFQPKWLRPKIMERQTFVDDIRPLIFDLHDQRWLLGPVARVLRPFAPRSPRIGVPRRAGKYTNQCTQPLSSGAGSETMAYVRAAWGKAVALRRLEPPKIGGTQACSGARALDYRLPTCPEIPQTKSQTKRMS
jgi:hypothetical protein